jgi:hypothetical protein
MGEGMKTVTFEKLDEKIFQDAEFLRLVEKNIVTAGVSSNSLDLHYLREIFNTGNVLLMGIKSGGIFVGYYVGIISQDFFNSRKLYFSVEAMYLEPSYRLPKFVRAIMHQIEAFSEKYNFSRVEISLPPRNTPWFLQELGYQESTRTYTKVRHG